MAKRAFEIIDIMNQADTENNSRLVALSNTMLGSTKTNKGFEVTMGVDLQSGMNLFEDTHMAILLVIEKEEYFRILNESKKEVQDV